jgi:molecular chaperone GrpE
MGSGDPRRKREVRSTRSASRQGRRSDEFETTRIEAEREDKPPPPPPSPVWPEEKLETVSYTAEDEIEGLRDKLLRMGAEFENYRKRQARDFNRLCSQGRKDLVEELLVVLDNFDRAEDHRNGSHSPEEIESGLVQTLQMLRSILEREGLSEIVTAEMDHFDPNIHEAVVAEDRDDLEKDSVLTVLQKGYRFGGELIRPVRVRVGRPCHEEGEDQ